MRRPKTALEPARYKSRERPRDRLVAHTAGFIIVDNEGYTRYHVNPRE